MLAQLITQGARMSQQIDNLKAQVEATKAVAQSAVSLIQSLKSGADPATLDAISADLKAATDALAAEVNR
jgi:hypothetical protein